MRHRFSFSKSLTRTQKRENKSKAIEESFKTIRFDKEDIDNQLQMLLNFAKSCNYSSAQLYKSGMDLLGKYVELDCLSNS